MPTHYGPKIITNGLVLYLDASNVRSYPGTGTNCFDLSKNENNGTLVGVTHNSSVFNFAGSGDRDGDPTGEYISVNDAITSTQQYNQGCTYSWWGRISAAQPNGQCILFGAASINHIEFKNEGSASPYFRTEARLQNGYSFGTGTIPGGSLVGRWINFTIVFANMELNRPVRWYANGDLFHTGSLDSGTYPGTEYFSFGAIGRATGTADFLYSNSYKGDLSIFKIYSRALTESEVIHNYITLKERHGL